MKYSKTTKKKRKKSIKEYSKKVLRFMILLWFIVALFGIGVTIYQLWKTPEYVNLDGLYNFVAIPISGGVVSYLIKSAIENKQKIKSSPIEETNEEVY